MFDELLNIPWSEVHFIRPQLLWLFIPAVLNLLFALIGYSEQVKWKTVIAPHLQKFIIKRGNEKVKLWVNFILFLCLVLAVLGVSGPTWKQVDLPSKTIDTPVVIALDLSQSMMAEDIQPNRLERAKYKIIDLLDEDPEAAIGVFGFAGSAHRVLPITSDYHLISKQIEYLVPSVMPLQGTNIDEVLNSIQDYIDKNEAPGIVLLFTDEVSEKSSSIIQSKFLTSKNQLILIPMLTKQGREIPLNSRGRVAMRDGVPIISALDENQLNKLNGISNITVVRPTLDNSDMAFIAKTIKSQLVFINDVENKDEQWEDRGVVLVIPLLVFVLLWFRKGYVLYSLLLIVSISSCDFLIDQNPDLWYTKDYQAQQFYDQGKFDQAATLYESNLHKGMAFYKQGDYERAIMCFEQDTSALGAYNLGVSYYKNGDYFEAEDAFRLATELDSNFVLAEKNAAFIRNEILAKDSVNYRSVVEENLDENRDNLENLDNEDLGGGGQEATEEQMKDGRKEESVETEIRTAEELDEVPADIQPSEKSSSQKVLMRKVNDDPSLFLRRKFKQQLKNRELKPKPQVDKW